MGPSGISRKITGNIGKLSYFQRRGGAISPSTFLFPIPFSNLSSAFHLRRAFLGCEFVPVAPACLAGRFLLLLGTCPIPSRTNGTPQMGTQIDH